MPSSRPSSFNVWLPSGTENTGEVASAKLLVTGMVHVMAALSFTCMSMESASMSGARACALTVFGPDPEQSNWKEIVPEQEEP
jgi:hypothetical protein